MQIDIDSLINGAIARAAIESGATPRVLLARGDGAAMLAFGQRRKWSINSARWSKEDRRFLVENIGRMTDGEIGAALGRTAVAIKIKRQRWGLAAHSKRPGWLTGHGAAKVLGSDIHSIMALTARGILPHVILPGRRGIIGVRKLQLYIWAVNPMNWIYFKRENVTDPHLRRLLELQAERWDDEWWTTAQTADWHGVDFQDVQRYVEHGKIEATKWGNWHILRSEATRPGLLIPKGKGAGLDFDWSDEGEAFILLALAVGFSVNMVGVMAGGWAPQRVTFRLKSLWKYDQVEDLIEKYDLRIRLAPGKGYDGRPALLADWREHPGRFPRLDRSMDLFRAYLAGEHLYPRSNRGSVTNLDLLRVRGVLHAWAQFYGETAEQRETARRLTYASQAHPRTLARAYHELLSWGIDPVWGCDE